MKVAVTGASGYLGGRLVAHLQNHGFDVRALSRRPPRPLTGPAVPWRMLDLDDAPSMEQALEGCTAVVHLAATDFAQSQADPEGARRINVEGTRRLLAAGKDLRTFIYFSTIHVYGTPLRGVLGEDTPANPQNAYARTHLEAEGVVMQEGPGRGVTPVVLRLSNGLGAPVYADCGAWTLISHDFVLQALRDGAIRARAPGNTERNFIPVRAVGEVVTRLLLHPRPGVLNVGSPANTTVAALAHLVQSRLRLAGIDVPLAVAPDASLEKFQFDTARLAALGWGLDVSMEDEIDAIINFARQHKAIHV